MTRQKKTYRGLHSLDDIFALLGKRFPKFAENRNFARVQENWPSIVGPHFAKHTRPYRLDGKVLTIEVDHSAWGQEVRLHQKTILDKLIKQFDMKIDEIKPLLKSLRTQKRDNF